LNADDFQSGSADGRFQWKRGEIGKIPKRMQGLCENFHKHLLLHDLS
jgi:hypothetical protein